MAFPTLLTAQAPVDGGKLLVKKSAEPDGYGQAVDGMEKTTPKCPTLPQLAATIRKDMSQAYAYLGGGVNCFEPTEDEKFEIVIEEQQHEILSHKRLLLERQEQIRQLQSELANERKKTSQLEDEIARNGQMERMSETASNATSQAVDAATKAGARTMQAGLDLYNTIVSKTSPQKDEAQ